MMDLFNVSGKLALVTGSSRGLGQALAIALAEAGARVVVHGRNADAVEATRTRIAEVSGTQAHSLIFDVTDATAVEAAMTELINTVGVPDILVNNAGLQRRAPIAEFSVADWDDIVAANLSGVFYVSRFLAPAMINRGSGKIVNIGSVQSLLARQTIAPYSATKGGVAQLTKGMAADLARHNIQVNAISPGYFATEMNKALVEDEQFNSWLINRTPAQRWGSFEELRGALIFLSSDASSFISGQNIFVDGGMTAVV
ncbi:MAG: SDR family oxidoreductase [Mycetocola sp.]